MTTLRRRLRSGCVAIALGFMAAGGLEAQATARFRGTVVDVTTRSPVPGARIALVATAAVTTTDSLGRFDIGGLAEGIHRFMVVAAGFPRSSLALAFARGEVIERTLELDSTAVPAAEPTAQPLPQVAVEAERAPPRRFADFDRRRRTGRGHYLDRGEIEKAGYGRLTDAVRSMRGVLVECGGGSGCYIRMARAPIGCLPEYIVDEQANRSFGLQTPIRDIEAIEVYVGASDVPGEFAGRNAGCGVIVIWTRVGPGVRTRSPEASR